MTHPLPLELAELQAWLNDQPALSKMAGPLRDALERKRPQLAHGDLPAWLAALRCLPELPLHARQLNTAAPSALISPGTALDADSVAQLQNTLMALCPWRKGPFRIGPLLIDSEWRSNLKWERLVPYMAPLHGRHVLDVGCGNGYHLWRMLGAGAESVLGIDPGLLFVLQFRALRHYLGPLPETDPNTDVRATTRSRAPALLPLTLDDLPTVPAVFDSVFSMGVLYHRRDPDRHLQQLRQLLRPAGELILETLIMPGERVDSLVRPKRYARMRNVWSLPTLGRLLEQLSHSGFTNARCVSIDVTSTTEQRRTHWMPFQSLADALAPQDPSLTIEGLPRPRRAVVLAGGPDAR